MIFTDNSCDDEDADDPEDCDDPDGCEDRATLDRLLNDISDADPDVQWVSIKELAERHTTLMEPVLYDLAQIQAADSKNGSEMTARLIAAVVLTIGENTDQAFEMLELARARVISVDD